MCRRSPGCVFRSSQLFMHDGVSQENWETQKVATTSPYPTGKYPPPVTRPSCERDKRVRVTRPALEASRCLDGHRRWIPNLPPKISSPQLLHSGEMGHTKSLVSLQFPVRSQNTANTCTIAADE